MKQLVAVALQLGVVVACPADDGKAISLSAAGPGTKKKTVLNVRLTHKETHTRCVHLSDPAAWIIPRYLRAIARELFLYTRSEAIEFRCILRGRNRIPTKCQSIPTAHAATTIAEPRCDVAVRGKRYLVAEEFLKACGCADQTLRSRCSLGEERVDRRPAGL